MTQFIFIWLVLTATLSALLMTGLYASMSSMRGSAKATNTFYFFITFLKCENSLFCVKSIEIVLFYEVFFVTGDGNSDEWWTLKRRRI